MHGCSAVSIAFPVNHHGLGRGQARVVGGTMLNKRIYVHIYTRAISIYRSHTYRRRRAFLSRHSERATTTRPRCKGRVLHSSPAQKKGDRERAGSCERRHTHRRRRHFPFPDNRPRDGSGQDSGPLQRGSIHTRLRFNNHRATTQAVVSCRLF